MRGQRCEDQDLSPLLAFSTHLVVLNQEPGREASERRTWAQRAETALLLSKDGSMILDDGRGTALHLFPLFRRTAFQLLMLFSEDGGRITEDVS